VSCNLPPAWTCCQTHHRKRWFSVDSWKLIFSCAHIVSLLLTAVTRDSRPQQHCRALVYRQFSRRELKGWCVTKYSSKLMSILRAQQGQFQRCCRRPIPVTANRMLSIKLRRQGKGRMPSFTLKQMTAPDVWICLDKQLAAAREAREPAEERVRVARPMLLQR